MTYKAVMRALYGVAIFIISQYFVEIKQGSSIYLFIMLDKRTLFLKSLLNGIFFIWVIYSNLFRYPLRVSEKINTGFLKGDSPQCGEMSRSDRGDGRQFGVYSPLAGV